MNSTLWDLTSGQDAVLGGFSDDLDPRFRTRLVQLGFRPGQRVTCMASPSLGAPRVYRVCNSVFSLEDTVARFIWMDPIGT